MPLPKVCGKHLYLMASVSGTSRNLANESWPHLALAANGSKPDAALNFNKGLAALGTGRFYGSMSRTWILLVSGYNGHTRLMKPLAVSSPWVSRHWARSSIAMHLLVSPLLLPYVAIRLGGWFYLGRNVGVYLRSSSARSCLPCAGTVTNTRKRNNQKTHRNASGGDVSGSLFGHSQKNPRSYDRGFLFRFLSKKEVSDS